MPSITMRYISRSRTRPKTYHVVDDPTAIATSQHMSALVYPGNQVLCSRTGGLCCNALSVATQTLVLTGQPAPQCDPAGWRDGGG
jgi:hypothetical protein